MTNSLSKIYDLRITLLNPNNWKYQDLYFHFFDSGIANKWIANFLRLKSSDHSFRERTYNSFGSLDSASQELRSLINTINSCYDIQIPFFEEFDQNNLSVLHTYFEQYGDRDQSVKNQELDSYFIKLNSMIHYLENKVNAKNRKYGHGSLVLASFDPRVDIELEDDECLTMLPTKNFGDLYLGYNTLGRNLQQAVYSLDSEILEKNRVNPQRYWSNEIMVSLLHTGNPADQLLHYGAKWKKLDADKNFSFGNFSKNREGYVVIGEMIPEQKDKLYSFAEGVDRSLEDYTAVHSVDLMFRKNFRDLENIKRIPSWKYPVKVQGPEIKEIRNEGMVYITWLLNNICNYSCRYCPEVLHNGKNVKYDWDLLEPFLEHLNIFYKDKIINFAFTGGEPTLSPFFPTMIKKIYELGHRSGITTNLSRTERYIEENFMYLDYASCSFHPAYEIKNSTQHDYLRKLALSSNITATNCRVMMDPEYWEQCMEFIEQIKELKIIDIQPVMIDSQYGFSSAVISPIDYTDKQLDWFAKFDYQRQLKRPDNPLYRIKENFSFAIFDKHDERISDPQTYINRGQTNFWNYQCMIGSESLFIDHDGKIQRANCGVTGKAGLLDNWKTIDWNRLKRPVSCTSLMCHCGTDVLISKKKVS